MGIICFLLGVLLWVGTIHQCLLSQTCKLLPGIFQSAELIYRLRGEILRREPTNCDSFWGSFVWWSGSLVFPMLFESLLQPPGRHATACGCHMEGWWTPRVAWHLTLRVSTGEFRIISVIYIYITYIYIYIHTGLYTMLSSLQQFCFSRGFSVASHRWLGYFREWKYVCVAAKRGRWSLWLSFCFFCIVKPREQTGWAETTCWEQNFVQTFVSRVCPGNRQCWDCSGAS